MPELPEVEVIRQGLAGALDGATVTGIHVSDVRALKRHLPAKSGGATEFGDAHERARDFEERLVGRAFAHPARRGKFLWVPLGDASGLALLGHLGMSGQLLLRTHDQPDDRHVRVRMWVESPEHGELRLDFCDQRLFGSLALDELVPTKDGHAAGWGAVDPLLPSQASHIARDPLDPAFSDRAACEALQRRSVGIKQAMLNQEIMSGVGNIYADEALWLSRIHPETPANLVSTRKINELLRSIHQVFEKALAEGGTSFDALYVNVNGESGYFAHSLNAYGRKGQPCPRCGTPIKRIAFANRGSHFCPRCQRKRS